MESGLVPGFWCPEAFGPEPKEREREKERVLRLTDLEMEQDQKVSVIPN